MSENDVKVYIVGGDAGIERMFRNKPGYKHVLSRDEADLFCFTGGADVSPSLYHAKPHPTTGCNPERDVKERAEFIEIADRGKPMVGICRGSQFLCVMNGGWLYQDVDRHAIWGTHDCYYIDENDDVSIHQVTSTHHQMQDPFTSHNPFELWGYAQRCTYRDHEEVKREALREGSHADVEIVFWPETNCLGFQGHPEYDSKECRDLFFTCLTRALSKV